MNMRHFAASALLFAVATMVSVGSFAKDDARLTALRAAEMTRFEAQVDADIEVLGQLLDGGLEYAHSNGDVDTKASFIDSLVTGKRDYVSAVATIESVRIFGDVGTIRGKVRVTVSSNGPPQDLHIGYTDVWVWKDGRWQLTAWRSSRLPDSPVR